MNNIFFYETEIGIIGIRENNKSITDIFFSKVDTNDNIEETDLIKECFKQLKEYFEGNRMKFDLPLDARGTEFQKKVWNELLNIPYGETKSYKDIAVAIGNEKACRAIGMANNKNPIPIIIPCHRVIGSNGKLVGYAGGVNVKEKLLNIEKIDVK
ncbi:MULTISPECIES: methylated-DNA--[protein]-cysteine S-methyltransferase [Terrisporobacter]|uniref:Methylated-DNA--protein-cysteine methyltransferase n=2 Tax=Terrisporobacter TaxID=1505652 RepID=A0A0B3VXS9_9FIRM|nr:MULTISPECIES: methylated-DNA--[protein]-cysteine S-methyltransferase [Terrisporobacter]KHS57464.1 cysteine methyltransferase [Terrisporobacter othiniensis]MCR1824805.1 methylated-DNA--[protein]-cysteine S-methyltransferase [Terrisporobacter muris]MDU6984582.1 methylated-DNA--[protein]-cysteine S-methyltransferase [Terrisporobacter othiniensis]MDY3374879.1 methylated-DNA--[protein]-cysteine S-methyltransferase [Terrisporobacter othiniensis]